MPTNNQELPISLNVNIGGKEKPELELRRITNDPEVIKIIIRCVYHDEPFLVVPKTRDKMVFVSNLISRGFLKKKANSYEFTF